MDVSVIIVSYNVRYFLESCLHSVFSALKTLEGEVIVVDNNSVDGSVTMVRDNFPQVSLIMNDANVGFAKANNQGIRIAQGRYILLLNPDTLIEDTTLTKVTAFMDEHPDAGALGVKMIDGKGKFLPESKRAIPTPGIAFFKVFGLSRLFPKSRRFNRYALGHLDPDRTHIVEVLSGAFMLIRKEALEKTGGLDEDFFMYGEDIDLSYRILKAGYRNYYFAGTTIIHYKGESTKKGSLNYVLMFYRAMLRFAEKHFSRSKSSWLGFIIRPAIYFRAALSILRRITLRLTYPVLDFVIFYLGYLFLVPFWEQYHFTGSYNYPDVYRHVIIPAYVLLWMAGIGFSGGYIRPVKLSRIIKGLLGGTLVILIMYALLPLNLRFSRALILIGAAWTLLSGTSYRFLLSFIPVPEFRLDKNRKKRVVVVGSETEYQRIKMFLRELPFDIRIAGFVSAGNNRKDSSALGFLDEMDEVIRIHDIHEVIFSAAEVPAEKIIAAMSRLSSWPVTFRVALPESSFILGSDSVRSAGELYLVGMNSITLKENLFRKRMTDLILSLAFVLTFPFIFLLVKNPAHFLKNCFKVLSGKYTWVGFCTVDENRKEDAFSSQIKPGIICPSGNLRPRGENLRDLVSKVNLSYARNYHPWKDIRIIFNRFSELGS
ncbi:MAG: glycosyltransferase [Chlorobi bacterium]|nr:glycosyltransferase [Chlorobiota bacterium]